MKFKINLYGRRKSKADAVWQPLVKDLRCKNVFKVYGWLYDFQNVAIR